MSNIRLFSVAFFLVFITISCNQGPNPEHIVTKKIQYDVTVSNANPELDWWVNNIEGSSRDPFIKQIFEKAESGEIKAYDYFNELLTPEMVKTVGVDTGFQILKRDYPPYAEYDTMIITNITYRDITRVRFLEEWYMDPATLAVEKKIVGLAPVYVRKYGDMEFNQVLFWVYPGSEEPVK